MIELMFPDGETVHGETYREVEDAWRASAWNTYPSRRAFRRAMRVRAQLWGGPKLRFRLSPTSKSFLHSLADVGLFRIEHSNEGRLV